MCTPLAKLAIGLSATMATGFYYLAAAPPASAVDVCGPGNYSSACVPDNTPSPGAASLSPSPDPQPASASLREPVAAPVAVESPVIPDPVAAPVVVESPVIPDPVVVESPAVIADPVTAPVVVESPAVIADPVAAPVVQPAAAPTFANIYTNAPAVRSTPIPEPGTAIALVLTGTGMICCGRKRNKQVRQQR